MTTSSNSLSVSGYLQNLKTSLEMGGQEMPKGLPPVTRCWVKVSNTAAISPGWPKVVFNGISLAIEFEGDTGSFDFRRMVRSTLKRDKPQPEALDDFRVKPAINRINGEPFLDTSGDEKTQGETLFPGQSLAWELEIASEILPFVRFKVDATLSRRHLAHVQQDLAVPESLSRPVAVAALGDLAAISLHRALESVIGGMPRFDNDTRLSEVQAFDTLLSGAASEVKSTREAVYQVTLKRRFTWVRAYSKSAAAYLKLVDEKIAGMKEAIATSKPENIAAAAQKLVALKDEAARLDLEIEELMRSRHIYEADIKMLMANRMREKMNAPKGVGQITTDPSLKIDDEELDLHAMMVEEALVRIDMFLEGTYNADKRRVWIVHGKGTGTLRRETHDYLKGHRLVKSFRLADPERGGDGATQVDLADQINPASPSPLGMG